ATSRPSISTVRRPTTVVKPPVAKRRAIAAPMKSPAQTIRATSGRSAMLTSVVTRLVDEAHLVRRLLSLQQSPLVAAAVRSVYVDLPQAEAELTETRGPHGRKYRFPVWATAFLRASNRNLTSVASSVSTLRFIVARMEGNRKAQRSSRHT